MTKKVVIIILALASFISVDAQNEVISGCVKRDGTESGINATSRFPMYSVMKFPQASAMQGLSFWRMVDNFQSLFSLSPPLCNHRFLM